jgi:chromosomal replication initiation ATPase DnaA
MRLKLLAEAASSYFNIDVEELLQLSRTGRNRHIGRVRHLCQWVACEAYTPRYEVSVVARFWGVDRTSIHYGCKMVRRKIQRSEDEKHNMQKFLKHLGNQIKNERNEQ